ncbi:RCC1 domain-containing protein [Serratia bockelmannii]|uniref:hypothetical protein n=1 Tax=Serratia bockelmannii TaxID=2703793 RepID=UPI003FA75668
MPKNRSFIQAGQQVAALCASGDVAWWSGDKSSNVGFTDSRFFSDLNAKAIYATAASFAALRHDGSVFVWGNDASGSSASVTELTEVTQIVATNSAFAALKKNGEVTVWGQLESYLLPYTLAEGVKSLYATSDAIAVITQDGKVRAWGDSNCRRDHSSECRT